MIGPQPKNLNDEGEEYHDDVAEFEYDDMPELISASASDSDDDVPFEQRWLKYDTDAFNKLNEFIYPNMAIENDDESDNESNGDDEPDSEHNPEQNPKPTVESEPENDSENESRPEPVKEKKLGRLKILDNKLEFDDVRNIPLENRWLTCVNLQYDIDEHVFVCFKCEMGFKPSENFCEACTCEQQKGYHCFKPNDNKTYIIFKSNQKRDVV